MIFLYNKHKENKMTTKQIKTIKIKTFKVIHFSMKVFILQHNCIKRTTTKCPKGEGKSDIGSYFLIMEINTSLILKNELYWTDAFNIMPIYPPHESTMTTNVITSLTGIKLKSNTNFAWLISTRGDQLEENNQICPLNFTWSLVARSFL